MTFLLRPPRAARAAGFRTAAAVRASLRLAPIALLLAAVAACTEKLDTKAACPTLCPNQDVTLRDTVFEAIALDTTLSPFPAKGAELFLLVSSDGSALDTRAVVRFDTLLRTFNRSATDTGIAITSLTTARVRFGVDTLSSVISAPFTVSVYDVDTPELDPSDATVLGTFTDARLLGTRTFASKTAVVGDSIGVSLDPARLAAKLSGNQRIRLGVRVTSTAPTQLRLFGSTTSAAGRTPTLAYDPTDSTDAIAALTVAPRSSAPAVSPGLAFNARDYTVVAAGAAPPVGGGEFSVGGLPARRVYLRFAIPDALLDSTTIVRATLLLTQRPSPGVDATRTVTLVPMLGLGGKDITDPARAALLVAGPEIEALGLTTVALVPSESGQRSLELATIVRSWRAELYDETPRAIVLRIDGEGYVPGELRFFSTEAADPAVRPRLRVNYVSRVTFGVP